MTNSKNPIVTKLQTQIMTVVLVTVAVVTVVIVTSFSKTNLGMGKKNPANYPHFVDKRLIPPHRYVEVASPDFMTNYFCSLINRQCYDRIESLNT